MADEIEEYFDPATGLPSQRTVADLSVRPPPGGWRDQQPTPAATHAEKPRKSWGPKK